MSEVWLPGCSELLEGSGRIEDEDDKVAEEKVESLKL